jgi:hypothetical protein
MTIILVAAFHRHFRVAGEQLSNYSEFCKPLNDALLQLAKGQFAESIKTRPSFRIMKEESLKMKTDMNLYGNALQILEASPSTLSTTS